MNIIKVIIDNAIYNLELSILKNWFRCSIGLPVELFCSCCVTLDVDSAAGRCLRDFSEWSRNTTSGAQIEHLRNVQPMHAKNASVAATANTIHALEGG